LIRRVLTAVLLLGCGAGSVVAEEILRTASVTYAAGKAIYVDAGQSAGLEVGELVRVLRGGEPVGELRVVASSA
jgi:hypothetical protein